MTSNSSNDSISTNGNSSDIPDFSRSSVPDYIQLPLFLLTIILACLYTILILIRRTFRSNKLNWFTINVCVMSALLSLIMLMMTTKRLLNVSSSLPCRVEGFFLDMGACQLMYSHCVVAVSRFLTIVYANKHIFRSTLCLWSCMGIGWLISILIAIPYLLLDGFACSNSTEGTFLSYYTLIGTLVLPAIIVGICNGRILHYVRNSSRQVHVEGNRSRVSHARDVRLIKIMIGTFITFFTGWAPVFLTQLFGKNNVIPSILEIFFQILPSLTVLFDVIFLIYTNQPVRLFLKQVFVRHPQHLQDKLVRAVPQNIYNIQNH
ncbi:unnamed protein product [Rotaria sp. Silwood2]|nr:unnamed protein product [Rotaria sp. Silwood2]CAF2662497.1 unnamed protein product [Rotaria sp. Silwood2]CAF3452487.1 unnamed protein product [Rotaria sp. Silwood2]CAF4367395.1 unnamed protein product [Rotaria sp. Silwood2]CAF4500865.1 unnamed protein product [Rotaria sp. Silwood2]